MVVVLSDRAFDEVLQIQVFLLVIVVEVFLLFCSCSKMCHQSFGNVHQEGLLVLLFLVLVVCLL